MTSERIRAKLIQLFIGMIMGILIVTGFGPVLGRSLAMAQQIPTFTDFTVKADATLDHTSGISSSSPGNLSPKQRQEIQQQIVLAYSRFPLFFEVNHGQTDPHVAFLARGRGYSLYLTPTESAVVLSPTDAESPRPAKIRMQFLGTAAQPPILGEAALPGRVQYLIGNNRSRWRTETQLLGRVRTVGIYPGIDLVYHGTRQSLEYDFIISPGANPQVIALGLDGAQQITLNASGDLVLRLSNEGDVRLRKPEMYQEVKGVRRTIPGGYHLHDDTRSVDFKVTAHDATQPLIINLVMTYSPYSGRNDFEEGRGIAVDGRGNTYVTGITFSSDFLTTAGTGWDAFITKLSPSGEIVYSTYLGGSSEDYGFGIVVDGMDNAYVTGQTFSPDFPTTAEARDKTLGGDSDAFVTKLSPNGEIVYSTYLGGKVSPMESGSDSGNGIMVDGGGNVYVTGETFSFDFPTTAGARDKTLGGDGDAFVTKFSSSGGLVYSTYLGGRGNDTGHGIAVDGRGNAYGTGRTSSPDFPTTKGAWDRTFGGPSNAFMSGDAFVTKLSPIGLLVYSTYLGGSDSDTGIGIAVDERGNAYVTGQTISPDFPTTRGAWDRTFGGPNDDFVGGDAFVTKLSPIGNLAYSTYLGGSGGDIGYGIAVNGKGDAYVVGRTNSPDFPTTVGARDKTLGGIKKAFVTKFSLKGGLAYSTYLGGSADYIGSGIAIDGNDNVYVMERTNPPDFPTTAGAWHKALNGHREVFADGDVFITKIAQGDR